MSPASFLFGIPNSIYGMVPLSPFVLFPLAILCMGTSVILQKKGRRHAAPRFINLESPPGVLYLRPFTEDTDWKVYYSWGPDRRPTSFRQRLNVLKFGLRRQIPTRFGGIGPEFGEIIADLTRHFGRMAAIGEPESPPILGADNVYVSDDNWQEKVLEMARGAKLVILTAGTTPGVIWETENIVRFVAPSRLLLNIPGSTPSKREKHYAAFRSVANDIFPRGLPPFLLARTLTFRDDWTPVLDQKNPPPFGSSAHVAWWMSRILS